MMRNAPLIPFTRRAALGVLTAGLALPVYAGQRVSNTNGVAIRGYDTTAYFAKGAATPGSDLHKVGWLGANWYFIGAEQAAAFVENPTAFAPQFGGFCTRAMSFGKTVHGDPEVWRIHQGKLYLFARPVGGEYFDKDPDTMIAKAQENWDKL